MSHRIRSSSVRQWQNVWRLGISPHLSTEGLLALLKALLADDLALIQGATTEPPPISGCMDLEPVGHCPLIFCIRFGQPQNPKGLGWTIADLEQEWAELLGKVDATFKQVNAHRPWFAFWDDSDRQTARWALMQEVTRTLAERKGGRAS